ncbi:MAG: hypothetical protein WCO91_10085, partial [Gemmataceae bacterium]
PRTCLAPSGPSTMVSLFEPSSLAGIGQGLSLSGDWAWVLSLSVQSAKKCNEKGGKSRKDGISVFLA